MSSSAPVAFARIDGKLLRRGFWLYVVKITSKPGKHHYYVGRTGDTSSPHASSLFSRLASHLDQRPTAKGNSLSRRVRSEVRLDCGECNYDVVGIGPLFDEQDTMDLHKEPRDKMAALERHLADLLGSRGYNVIGTHPRRAAVDASLLEKVMPIVDQHFPAAPGGDDE